MINVQVSKPGDDVFRVNPKDLLLDDTYPAWMCDVRKSPKRYGIVKIRAILPALVGDTDYIAYQIEHGYNYIPSYLCIFNYPAGTTTNPATKQTYGTGAVAFTNPHNGGVFYRVDNKYFNIIVKNLDPVNAIDFYVEIRFYIFANKFSKTLQADTFFSSDDLLPISF